MLRITIDAELRQKLGLADPAEPAELYDESGAVLGYFTPATAPSLYSGIQSPCSEEELRRRESESESFTTAQLLDRLGKL